MMPQNSLSVLVGRGGVYYNVSGSDSTAVLKAAVKGLKTHAGFDREEVLAALIERESLASTAIGDGFAIPHPRHLLIHDPEASFVSVVYMDQPVEWGAIDGKKVTTLFIMLSSDEKEHLETLASIGWFCRQKDFKVFMAGHPSTAELREFIELAERVLN